MTLFSLSEIVWITVLLSISIFFVFVIMPAQRRYNERHNKPPMFRSRRVHQDLKRLRAEGYDLDEDGIVICSTCGENWCGQCGMPRMGFTFNDYRETFWK